MTYLVDSCAWIEYFSGSVKGKKIKEFIENKPIFISILALAELADKFAREKKPFEQHLLFIQSKAAIIPISIPIALNAAVIKLKVRTEKPKFGLADAIQLATAQEKEILLLTTDNDFSKLNGVLIVN